MALVGLGNPTAATAAPSGNHHTGRADTAKAAVERVCSAPKKGQFSCFALRRTDILGPRGVVPHADPTGWGAGDLRDAYNLPADGGAGETIAIVDAYDDPNAEADLAVYRAQYGLPPCTTDNGCFRKVDQRGGTDYPAPDTGWAGEISLDLDMVSAAAPNAHILLVEGDEPSFEALGTAVNTAVALGAKYVSNSYGTDYTGGAGEDSSVLQLEEQYYKHPGVAVVASSGDDDYGVAFPADSQYVTSVGGTALTKDDSARGWHESVWHNSYGGPGSGCSAYVPKPAFQTDSGCDMRAVSDVSAVADPVTGVAVYQTYGGSGWAQYGGTSASAPIIAGVYASAGTPPAGSYPNAFPYANAGALNDVTEGANGTCDPDYLCTAGAGYDGPTGLGTPNGLAAFRSGPHGVVTGTVSDSAGAPIPGASVAVGDSRATTGTDGTYEVTVEPGTYDVTASAYGYADRTVTGVEVTDGGSVTENFALAEVAKATVTGTVTDGSGHAWPLYAAISVDGVPGAPVHTDPYTGRYSIDLPRDHTYTLHVTPAYPGYSATDATVELGDDDTNQNIAVTVDSKTCVAPGYAVAYQGTHTSFDGTSAPDGWTVANATDGGGWSFDDAGGRGNKTGGTGNFAIVDSDDLGIGNSQDTTLTSPVTDLSAQSEPVVGFDTYYQGYSNQVADVDVSTDGTTWKTVWERKGSGTTSGHQEVAVPDLAGVATAQVRFHFTGTWGYYWEVDNAYLGVAGCKPVHGGLVAGQVTDANTGDGVGGAKVSSVDAPAETAATSDPDQGAGFYWMFSSKTGSHGFTAAHAGYTADSHAVSVATNYVTRADFTLKAGKVDLDKQSVSRRVDWGGTGSAAVTVTNSGGEPAKVTVNEQQGGFDPKAATGTPTHNVTAAVTRHSLHDRSGKVVSSTGTAPTDANPAADAWTSVADYPMAIQDNAVAVYDGKVYSAFGYNGSADVADLYVYDPATGEWSKLSSAADTREGVPAHGFIGGKLYVVGGWGASGSPDTKLEIYNPGNDSWSTGTAAPAAYAGAGSAVLNGKLYAVGGCTGTSCGSTAVWVYDAAGDSWSQAADYPESTAWETCGAVAGKVYCAGGSNDSSSSKHAYAYDPASDTWTQVADLPLDMWGSAGTGANGKLLVSGGVINDSSQVTNQGFAYDPGTDSWTALPNSNTTLYRSGSALGLYKVGGNPGGQFVPPVPSVELLSGYDQGGDADVPWLSLNTSTFTLAPGASKRIRLTFDASVPEITQPGTFTASLAISTDTPYAVQPVAVTFRVNPPDTWGKITGTVSGTDAKGNVAPLAGATVQIDSWAQSFTLKTDKNGNFSLWLDTRNNPLQVIFAKDGYQPQVKTVNLKTGKTVTVTITLKHA